LEDEKTHKFQSKMDLTYEQYIHACYDGIIQLSRELEQILGREKTLEMIGKAREKHDLELVKKHLSGRKTIKNFEDFKAFMKELHESSFTSHLFTIKYLGDTATEIEFHTTECLLAKVFRDMKAADLGYVMICQPDFVTTPSYCPNVSLRRTKTLMQGDDHCDTTYCFSGSPSNCETRATS
jgi:hypothetical protein